jgi:hypothetical protein
LKRSLVALLALSLASCAPDTGALVVLVVTDLEAGEDFVGVELEVLARERGLAHEDFVATGGSWLTPVPVAEVHGLPLETLLVRVTLLAARRQRVASREVVVMHTGDRALTVVIGSSCASVACPAAGDAPDATSCVAGECRQPDCVDCADQCESDGDCPPSELCGAPQCRVGLCLYPDGAERCATGEACHPTRGCVPTTIVVGCLTDADCPAPVLGSWSVCEYADTCALTGARRRDVTTFRCSAERCEPRTSSEPDACARTTDGSSCGESSCDSWTECGFEPCATEGARFQTCHWATCVGGVCRSDSRESREPCSRGSQEGLSCMINAGYGYCHGVCSGSTCGQLCVDCGGFCVEAGCYGGTCR